MTQKELLYVEDAIKHECNIIKFLEDTITNLKNSELQSFLKSECKKHNNMKERLIKCLEVCSND